jgi:hypothetical protein
MPPVISREGKTSGFLKETRILETNQNLRTSYYLVLSTINYVYYNLFRS